MRRWRGKEGTEPPSETVAPTRYPAMPWLIGFMLYTCFLVILFWAPFEFTHDKTVIKSQLNGFFAVPFARLYRGSYTKALFLILRKTLWFAPLGVLTAHTIARFSVPPPQRRVLLGAAVLLIGGVASGIELGQVLMPNKVADLTDVFLTTIGGIAGLIITTRILASHLSSEVHVKNGSAAGHEKSSPGSIHY